MVADRVEFLEWGDRPSGGAAAPARQDDDIPAGFEALEDEDIPF